MLSSERIGSGYQSGSGGGERIGSTSEIDR